MLVLDLRILFVTPFAMAELFLLWILWGFVGESLGGRSRAQSRLASLPEVPASGPRAFKSPTSDRAA